MGFRQKGLYNEATKRKGESIMKGKKWMALLLSGVMTASALAVGEAAFAGQENTEVDLYGFEEPVTIKVGYSYAADFTYKEGESATNNNWVKLYNEHNILTDILYEVDSSQAATKLTTAIISGDYPDILSASSAEYVNYAQTDVIADITDVFEQYASDELKEYLNVDGGLAMSCVTLDGRIYGLPNMGNSYDSVSLMFIRQDWLDNLGLQVPTTMEELKEVAHAFTYDDPDQNGADDTYGLAVDGKNILTNGGGDVGAVFAGYGAYPGANGMAFVEYEDGVVTWGGTNAEGMKAGLQLLQDLYKDGCLAKDFITMDGNSIFEEAGAGRCGIWFGPMWAGMVTLSNALTVDANAHVVCAPVPDGLDQGGSKVLLSNAMGNVYCVSSKCEYPEVLIKLMNLSVQKLCYPESDEEYLKYYGQAGGPNTGWKTSLTQTLVPLKNYENFKLESAALLSGDTDGLNAEQKSDYENMKVFLEAWEADDFDTEKAQDPVVSAGAALYTVFGDPKGSYAAIDQLVKNDGFVPSAYNALPTESMSENEETLRRLTVETIVKIITDSESVDYYDTFLKTWYTMGGEEVIADAQAWVDGN